MPKFPVIIPVYNVAQYLGECLDSVKAQTFTAWEAICVDDGSSDDSGKILDEYARKDPRFKVFHRQNAGVSAARNAGIREAQGEFIAFLDGDDEYPKDRFAILNDCLERHPGVQIAGGPATSDILEMGRSYYGYACEAQLSAIAYSYRHFKRFVKRVVFHR
ncbi:MAG: glycosyltransferase family 2 protein [Kiritimatiellae bacterium]|nr:glycosyltransferase family 2 protein [Kiritimatiellia bacterium]